MFDNAALVQQIRNVPHFRGLPDADLKVIVTSGQILRFSGGSDIFLEGDPCAGLFVLLQGQVNLCKLGPRGQMSIMGVIKPVIMFNEVAALDGGVNPATAVATRDCLVWQVGYERFQVLIERYPQVGLGLLRVLAARNRLLISHFEDLSFRSVLARTAKLLLDLSQQGDKSIDRREHTNYELAARVGTVPEALSRSLRFFREQGYISGNRASLEVNVPDKLAEHAELEPEFFKA